MTIIEAHELRRDFTLRRGALRRQRHQVRAVDGISFSVGAGSAVGYIGANGAGKSTTIKMLTGILVPTSGTVRTCGLEPVRQRRELARRIGVVFGQRSQLWWDLPLAESFRILAAVHRLSDDARRRRTDELIERLALGDFLGTPVRQLSLGQRMRGEVAAALLHRPELVVLDEPTIGLDVLSKEQLRVFLREQRTRHGTTLLLTTHDMGDIERLCDQVLVIDRGQLAYSGTLPGLSGLVTTERVLVVDLTDPTPPLDHVTGTRLMSTEADGLRQRLAFSPDTATAADVLAAVSRVAEVRDLSVEEPQIEDVVRRLYEQGIPNS
ncbi:MAG TPA: ATP-binding cassette domain-containing protein [Jatrophihabitantaceae bacterium]|jgi:ABC-2 type transport system ATP-binding protein